MKIWRYFDLQKKKEYLADLQSQMAEDRTKAATERRRDQTERSHSHSESRRHSERMQHIRDRKLQQLK